MRKEQERQNDLEISRKMIEHDNKLLEDERMLKQHKAQQKFEQQRDFIE